MVKFTKKEKNILGREYQSVREKLGYKKTAIEPKNNFKNIAWCEKYPLSIYFSIDFSSEKQPYKVHIGRRRDPLPTLVGKRKVDESLPPTDLERESILIESADYSSRPLSYTLASALAMKIYYLCLENLQPCDINFRTTNEDCDDVKKIKGDITSIIFANKGRDST